MSFRPSRVVCFQAVLGVPDLMRLEGVRETGAAERPHGRRVWQSIGGVSSRYRVMAQARVVFENA